MQFYEKAILKARKAELKATSKIFNSEKSILAGCVNNADATEKLNATQFREHKIFGNTAHVHHQQLIVIATQLDNAYQATRLEF